MARYRTSLLMTGPRGAGGASLEGKDVSEDKDMLETPPAHVEDQDPLRVDPQPQLFAVTHTGYRALLNRHTRTTLAANVQVRHAAQALHDFDPPFDGEPGALVHRVFRTESQHDL